MAKDVDPLWSGVSKLFNSKDFSYFTIRCGDREWPAHKAVLCTQSEYSDRVVRAGFKESHENAIELHEDDPNIVQMMLVWLYTGKYGPIWLPDDALPSVGGLNSVELHVPVFEIADKYLLPKLKAIAAARFDYWAHEFWNIKGFAVGIAAVYDLPSDVGAPLRKTVMDVVRLHSSTFLHGTATAAWWFRKTMDETPELGASVAMLMSEKVNELSEQIMKLESRRANR